MFRGKHLLMLDEKGRFAMPKRYRERLAGEDSPDLVMTVDPYEPCLVLYPMHEWNRVEERLHAHPGWQPGASEDERVKADWLARQIVGNAEDCKLDGHGRLLIASELRRRLGLVKQPEEDRPEAAQETQLQVRLVGQMSKVELWNEATWSERSGQQFVRNKEIADRYMSAGPAGAPAA